MSTAGGVPAGAITMVVGAKSKPGMATSAMVGMVGACEKRLLEFCASSLTRLSLTIPAMAGSAEKIICTWPPTSAGVAWPMPLNGT